MTPLEQTALAQARALVEALDKLGGRAAFMYSENDEAESAFAALRASLDALEQGEKEPQR